MTKKDYAEMISSAFSNRIMRGELQVRNHLPLKLPAIGKKMLPIRRNIMFFHAENLLRIS